MKDTNQQNPKTCLVREGPHTSLWNMANEWDGLYSWGQKELRVCFDNWHTSHWSKLEFLFLNNNGNNFSRSVKFGWPNRKCQSMARLLELGIETLKEVLLQLKLPTCRFRPWREWVLERRYNPEYCLALPIVLLISKSWNSHSFLENLVMQLQSWEILLTNNKLQSKSGTNNIDCRWSLSQLHCSHTG